jgi:hypothetical protein
VLCHFLYLMSAVVLGQVLEKAVKQPFTRPIQPITY